MAALCSQNLMHTRGSLDEFKRSYVNPSRKLSLLFASGFVRAFHLQVLKSNCLVSREIEYEIALYVG